MKSRKIIGLILTAVTVLCVLVCTPLALTTKTQALAATAVTLTDGSGDQTVLSGNVETATYSWDSGTSTLTLNSWSGRQIYANGEFTLHLKGTNTVTLTNDGAGTIIGIDAQSGMKVTADADGVLNITDVETGLTREFYGIYGALTLEGGTVNIDLKTSDLGSGSAGIWGAINLLDETDATLNINVKSTDDSYGKLYGSINGSLNYKEDTEAETVAKAKINISLEGTEKNDVQVLSSINVISPRAQLDITLNADNNNSVDRSCCAIYTVTELEMGPESKLDCTGEVQTRRNMYQLYLDGHMQTTTPADNAYYWKDMGDYYLLADLSGNALDHVVFEYKETLADFKWVGEGLVSIPGGVVGGERIYVEPLAALTGASNTYDMTPTGVEFELIGGELPAGLDLRADGVIDGVFEAVSLAGTVKIRATDKVNSRSVEFEVPYGEVVEADKFITVDGTKVEMKADGSGAGWSYSGATKTLTLNGYNGGKISAEKAFTLHLKGTNTVTLTNDGEGTIIGIDAQSGMKVTADADGVLNIKDVETGLTREFYGIYGAVTLEGGTVNIDLETSDLGGASAGIWGAINLLDETDATLNINVKSTDNSYGKLYGSINGGFNYEEDTEAETVAKAKINISLEGTEKNEVQVLSSINVISPRAQLDITLKADNNNSVDRSCCAIYSVTELEMGPESKLDCTGEVRTNQNMYKLYLDGHMQTTTPANNAYYWKDLGDYYLLADLSGNVLNNVVFEYNEALADFKWVGDGFVSIPGGVMGGERIYVEPLAALTGASNTYYLTSTGVKFELIGGELPAGLDLRADGVIEGTFTAVSPAGTVKIRATDKMGTSDTSDDRVVEFTVPYGAVTSNNPVLDVTLDKTELILSNGGSGSFTATVTPNNAAHPYVDADVISGGWLGIDIDEPVNGASKITVTSNGTAGVFTLRVTSEDMGIHRDITVYVREKTPEITVDYIDEELHGFSANRTYIITPEGGTPTEVVAVDATYIDLREEWIGKTLSIVLKNGENDKSDSSAQTLAVPERPAAPTPGKTDASANDANDGTITGVNNTMEYQLPGEDYWYSVSGDTVKYLGIGTYFVRYKATGTAFASSSATLVIGYGELAFADSDLFDVPGDQTGSPFAVDVSGAVSGGKKPYVYSIDGPAWLSINAGTGVISGTRPESEQAATTATITVTDADSVTESITINVGKVSLPHVHEYVVQRTEGFYLDTPADCENPAKYYFSCECGAKGSSTFTHGTNLGHSFTEEIEDEAHLKEKGADCQTANTYWYDCARCEQKSDTEFYEGNTMGDHNFGTDWDHKDASGHAHKCTVAGCGEHDTPVAHTPGEAATELSAQLCTDCGYELAPKKPHVHSIVKRDANPASCTEPGNILYYECTGLCGKYFSDPEGTQEIVDKTSVILSKLGHDYTERLQNELHLKTTTDCKTPNTYWYNCSRCTACAKDDAEATDKFYEGTVYGSHAYGTLIPAVSEKHTENELVASVAAHYHCSVCDKYFTEAKVETSLEALRGETPSHTYGDWQKNAEKHWKECACGKRSEESDHKDQDSNGRCDTCEQLMPVVTTPSETTPVETPVATTPVETPVATTPVETPVATTPVETPVATTPVETPVATTPVETPVATTPVETPVATTPVETPVATTPVETPVATTPVETPVATTPVETPVATTPVETPVATTPVETPVATTPVETPVATTPVETPVATTPVETPAATTPVETPVATTLVETPLATTPVETPVVTTPVETSVETPPADTTPTDPDVPGDEGLPAGAVVAIVIGSTVVVGGGGFALFWFVIKKKSIAELLMIFKKK